MLNFMSQNWEQCTLSKQDREYDKAICKYLQAEYNDTQNLPLKHDKGEYIGVGFKTLSDSANKKRNEHTTERNYCYNLFMEYGADVIGEILNMYNYVHKDFDYIDFATWAAEIKCIDFVKKLSAI